MSEQSDGAPRASGPDRPGADRGVRRGPLLLFLLAVAVAWSGPVGVPTSAQDHSRLARITMSPLDTIPLPSAGLRGLAFGPGPAWLLMSSNTGLSAPDSAFEGTVLRFDPETAAADTLVRESSSFDTGLAYDGEFLWAGGCLIGQPAALYQIDPGSGEVPLTLPAMGFHPGGLVWDEEYLWQVDADARRLFRVEREEGKVSRRVSSPSFYPTGLAYDGFHFWSADAATGRIYRMRGFNGRVDAVVSDDVYLRTGDFITLGWDGSALWVAGAADTFAVRYVIHD